MWLAAVVFTSDGGARVYVPLLKPLVNSSEPDVDTGNKDTHCLLCLAGGGVCVCFGSVSLCVYV